MSFRDCIATRQPAACKDAPSETPPQAQAAASPLIHSTSYQEDVFLSPRSVVGTSETAVECLTSAVASRESIGCYQNHGEGNAASGLPKGNGRPSQNACSDEDLGLQAAARRPSSHAPSATVSAAASVAASLHSGGVARRGKTNNRIINASAPITFTKTFCTTVQWGSYATAPKGYLNAETVHAAAAAAAAAVGDPATDGSFACFQHSTQEAAGPIEAQRQYAAHSLTLQHHISRQAMRNRGEDNRSRGVTTYGGSVHTDTSSYRQSTRAAATTRPTLGSWLFRGSGASTELERLLKQENDIAETAAARNELAATKLLQEDMEAMIANLQQVKAFLVDKLRECETALLETAQERDDLEATLQQIQSGIQDSVAENRRVAEDCKEKLAQKEREVEELRSQLERANEEAMSLRKENETLKAEVNIARVEAADLATVDGFRIEEYRAAIQTLMERNKTQRRELKRLRGHLIRTREDFASALARIDELETLEEFRRLQMQPDETAASAAAQEASPRCGHSVGSLQRDIEGSGAPPNSGGMPADERGGPGSSQQQREDQAEGRAESSARSCDADAVRKTEDASRRPSKSSCTDTSSGTPRLAVRSGTPTGRGLGRSVKGLLTSGVTQLLQRFENAMSADRDPPELLTDPESQGSADTPPEGERGLHEEAARFLERTRGSSDLIVHLEDGEQAESGDDAYFNPQEADSRNLKNVARSVWQAAHELLADRAMPPARLSTLRTVAAGNPSAWEVLRERHKAAKSMPLFSSIPPAAYPLMAHARESRQRSGSTAAGSRAGSSASSSARTAALARRRGPAGAASASILNMRSLGRIERGRRGVSPDGCVTVELPSEIPACTSGAASDIAEASERSEEPIGRTTPAEREANLPASTVDEEGGDSAAVEGEKQQTTSPSDAAEQPEANAHRADTPQANRAEGTTLPDASDAIVGGGGPAKDDGV